MTQTDIERALFLPKFSRAELYGMLVLLFSLANGARALIAVPLFLAWMLFGAWREAHLR